MKSLIILNECMFSKEQIQLLKTKFSSVTIYNDTVTEEQAISRIGKNTIVILDQFLLSFSEKLLKKCRKIELIIVNTTAYDAIDINLLNKYGVKLAHIPSYATQDVAEVAIGMIFALNNHVKTAEQAVIEDNVKDIFPGHPIIPLIKRKQLKGQTIGIVGLGKIGKRCAEMCQRLRMNVVGFNKSKKIIKSIKTIPLTELFEKSDIILISMAYKKNANDYIISKQLLSRAKKDALLISIAHPNLIDIGYLIKNPSHFRGIGFDYLVTDAVKELMKIRKNNIIVTPHLGSQSIEAIENMTATIIEAAISFSANSPKYLVN